MTDHFRASFPGLDFAVKIPFFCWVAICCIAFSDVNNLNYRPAFQFYNFCFQLDS